MRKNQIFIVDDDLYIRSAIAQNIKDDRFECTCFERTDDCLQQLRLQNCDLLVILILQLE